MIKTNYLKTSLQETDINKTNNLCYNINGVGQADRGRYKEALESFTKAININPKDSKSYFNRASVKMELGDINGANLDFREAEKLKANCKHTYTC